MWRLKCSSRARSTCKASNGKIDREHTAARPPGATVRHLTQEAAKCRGKFLTGQNVERLHRLLIAFRERVESTTQSDQSGILTSTSHSSYQEHTGPRFSKAPGWISRRFLPLANTRRKAKVVRAPRWSDFNDSIRVGGQDYSAAAWRPATISGLGSA